MIPDDRHDDVRQFLDDLTALTRRYGLELTNDPGDGLAIRDQEHDAVLARNGAFEPGAGGYRFDVPDVTANAYPEGDGGT
jgi:hypothetical protein